MALRLRAIGWSKTTRSRPCPFPQIQGKVQSLLLGGRRSAALMSSIRFIRSSASTSFVSEALPPPTRPVKPPWGTIFCPAL